MIKEKTNNQIYTLTVEDLAEALNISKTSAYQLVRSSDFPKLNIGKRIVVPIDDFKIWMSKMTQNSKIMRKEYTNEEWN